MGNSTNAVSTTVEDYQEEILTLKQQNAELEAKLRWYEEQFRLSVHKRYGCSSERTIPEQISIFNEAEEEAKPSVPEPTIEEITYNRRKKVGHREAMLEDLPVEVIEYHLPEEERICPSCNSLMHKMSTEVRRELKIIPVQVSVVMHVKDIYSCRDCEKEGIETPIITAPMPNPVIPGSLASPSIVAHVMEQKFVESRPLYRQEKQFDRLGIELSRQTLANWMIECSERWLTAVYSEMKKYLLKKDILYADETTLQVLKEPGREADNKSYMWMYRTGRDGPPIILYDYQTTRASKHPKKFLSGFKGYLHVDGYAGYHDLQDIKLVGCWAHARRKFDEALKALPADKKNTPTVSREGLNYCNQLFAIESELKDCVAEERYKSRQSRSKPIVNNFLVWLKYQTPRVLPKSALGGAMQYCRNQWDKLQVFLEDGRLELDNNRSERSIKPFVIGRKNWLFSNTPRGANSSAVIYSVIETAKENGLNPFMYLMYLFERLPNMKIKDINAVLPWSDSLPDSCKVNK